MFDESPLYYILISLIFLTIFGSIVAATWLVWLTPVPVLLKAVLTILGACLGLISIALYTLSAD